MEKICVAVRVRPFVSNECRNLTAFWNIDDNRISLHRIHGTPISGVSYTFDHVFDESCSNASVYELLTKDIIRAAVEGFNGTAFAYGQTSSGKTFTMNGSDTDPGIIRLAVRDVFDEIHKISDREFLVRVSYMEIYNEEINDLLAVENQKLQIHESLERGIFVAGLREEIVNDAEQVLKLTESGEVNRHFGETNMNARSSRSHTIFRMVIESRGKDDGGAENSDAIRVSVLNLVDLAGSERIAKTGADGVRLKEGKYINKSLMVLGNVINKLSEGPKQRGHIPYRDSKLTRILQPALGGNAKTSIICTVAPEEVHIEETKGTLQFASRAKRITNCAQVNEILTDAALLKRQKLEIEELRGKLQGSHAEVLEQEILKLRNEMLKYELEREKLEMELEEERKTHKERDQWIREQQMKIDTLSSLVSFSDTDRSSTQNSAKESVKEEFSSSNCISHGDLFRTPSDRAGPNSFVVKRSNYPRQVDFTPPPDTVSNVADEETWLEMNRGYIADLDLIQMTPARRIQSFPPSETTPVVLDDVDKNELHQIKRQLELAVQEKNELERKHTEQVQLNQKMMQEVCELQKEAQLIQEIPKRLCQSLVNCKDLYEDIFSTVQNSVDGEASKVKLLSKTREISSILFPTLEMHLSMLMDDYRGVSGNGSIFPKHYEMLRDRLYNDVKSLVSKPSPSLENEQPQRFLCDCTNKDCALQEELAGCEGDLIAGFNAIKQRFLCMQKELDESNRLHAMSKERCFTLERDFAVLKEERDFLLQRVAESTEKASVAIDQKENALKDLNAEVQRRKSIKEEIKQFSAAISDRQKSKASSYSDLKAKIEKMTAEYHVFAPKSLR